VGSASVRAASNITVTGVQGNGVIGNVLVWGLIPENQTPNWQAVNDAQTSNWVQVAYGNTVTWVEVTT
jgi:hypothetical protein